MPQAPAPAAPADLRRLVICGREMDPRHELLLSFVGKDIAVSCTCQLEPPFSRPGKGRPLAPFELRPKWTAAEVLECWRAARHFRQPGLTRRAHPPLPGDHVIDRSPI